MKGKDS
jgi:hypothetical protein